MRKNHQTTGDQLTQFWNEMPCEAEPFVHPRDRDWMLAPKVADSVRLNAPADPKDWIEEARGSRVQFGLLPIPYLGDLKRADIIICLLNPGLEAGDFHAELRMREFRAAVSRSLRQDFQGDERYPFLFLDPQWCWTGGHRWWAKKLKGIISAISEFYECSFDDATAKLACRIAAVELFPYHSATFAMHRALTAIPSCDQAREFVRKAIHDSDKIVIVTRQAKAWQLPRSNEPQPNLIVYKDGQERGAHLSPGTTGGQAVLSKLGISNTTRTVSAEHDHLPVGDIVAQP
ncbi:hypothetical protein [Rhizobium sp. TRM95796]|uniref:hypothetical protein n=1 Tax=Rhizobium sp. TRM95796 TaxID=2979862 RepID=UPI0021E86C9D|nr:hypothetical protein [Rhizobium sp. TRM95796]MCV3766179.1 hypothetical protein [Rhizobium sp. TRM95796]